MKKKFISLEGRILLDSGILDGSFFNQTAVLICHHDSEGAWGFVLNYQEASFTLSELLGELVPDKFSDMQVKVGGPIGTKTIFCLTEIKLSSKDVLKNIGEINVTGSLNEIFNREEGIEEENLTFYLGYAGWSAGQLEEELERSIWIVSSASEKEIFESDNYNLWKKKMRKLGGNYSLISYSPHRLSDN